MSSGLAEAAPKRDLSTIATTDIVYAGPAQLMPAMVLPPLRPPLAGIRPAPSSRSAMPLAAGDVPSSLAVQLPVAAGGAPRPQAIRRPSAHAPVGLTHHQAGRTSHLLRGQPLQGQALLDTEFVAVMAPLALQAPQTHALWRPPRVPRHASLGVAGTESRSGQMAGDWTPGVAGRPSAEASVRGPPMRPPSGAMQPPRSRATIPTPPAGPWPIHHRLAAQAPAPEEASQGRPAGTGQEEWDALCVLVTDHAEKAFMTGRTVYAPRWWWAMRLWSEFMTLVSFCINAFPLCAHACECFTSCLTPRSMCLARPQHAASIAGTRGLL